MGRKGKKIEFIDFWSIYQDFGQKIFSPNLKSFEHDSPLEIFFHMFMVTQVWSERRLRIFKVNL